MSINYTSYIAQITNLMVTSTADTNFNTMVPGMIDYAEQRLYRELDLLTTYVTDASATVTPNVKVFNYPTSLGTFLVIDQINILSSAGTTSSNATRVPLQVASKDFVNTVYPNNATAIGVPIYFSPATATTCFLAPIPDQAYGIEVIGTQRPTPLSTSNSSTFLTQVLPDLFIAASMIFASGYMRNFGSQSDNPQMAQSWQTQYDALIQSANNEELRKKYQGMAWQNQNPNQNQRV